MTTTKNPAVWRAVDFTTTPADPPTTEAMLWVETEQWLNGLGITIDERQSIEYRHTLPCSEAEFRLDGGLLVRVTWDYDGAPDGSGWSIDKVEIEDLTA